MPNSSRTIPFVTVDVSGSSVLVSRGELLI